MKFDRYKEYLKKLIFMVMMLTLVISSESENSNLNFMANRNKDSEINSNISIRISRHSESQAIDKTPIYQKTLVSDKKAYNKVLTNTISNIDDDILSNSLVSEFILQNHNYPDLIKKIPLEESKLQDNSVDKNKKESKKSKNEANIVITTDIKPIVESQTKNRVKSIAKKRTVYRNFHKEKKPMNSESLIVNEIRKLKKEVFGNENENMKYYKDNSHKYDIGKLTRALKIARILEMESQVNQLSFHRDQQYKIYKNRALKGHMDDLYQNDSTDLKFRSKNFSRAKISVKHINQRKTH